MATILRYFTEFGKPAFQHTKKPRPRPSRGEIYARVYCIWQ